jgi:hypothetical protein
MKTRIATVIRVMTINANTKSGSSLPMRQR